MSVAAWCSLHDLALCRLRPNMTSSIKPEVHNIVQCHRRRIEPQGICTQNFVQIGPVVQRYACWDKHTHTDRQTHSQTGWSQYTAPIPGWSNYSCMLGSSVVRSNEVQYLSNSTSNWRFFYLSKSKKYRSFLSTFKVKSKSTETQKSTV